MKSCQRAWVSLLTTLVIFRREGLANVTRVITWGRGHKSDCRSFPLYFYVSFFSYSRLSTFLASTTEYKFCSEDFLEFGNVEDR